MRSMGVFGWYFDKEKGLKKPSVSILMLARYAYAIELIGGVIGAAACLVLFLIGLFNEAFSFVTLLGAVLIPLAAKLSGWLTALALNSVAVVVESHEKNLGIEEEKEEIRQPEKENVSDKLSGFRITKLDTDDPQTEWYCEHCGRMNKSQERVCVGCGKRKRG